MTPKLPTVGVIMLRTAFPRPCGDIGNPQTFGSRVLYEVVEGATVARVMGSTTPDAGLSAEFVGARDRLVSRGAEIVTTSCGVLVLHQRQLSRECPVPVTTSALFQLPRRIAEFGSVGVMAMDSSSIDRQHLAAAGAPTDIPRIGLEDGAELYPVLRANSPGRPLDPRRAEADVVEAGRRLLAAHPDLCALVLECTNLPPYRVALSRALSLPVFDILTWLEEVWHDATTSDRPA
jgi:hypothetical protein